MAISLRSKYRGWILLRRINKTIYANLITTGITFTGTQTTQKLKLNKLVCNNDASLIITYLEKKDNAIELRKEMSKTPKVFPKLAE